MSNVNKVTLLGRLGRDPEVRNLQNGGRVVNLAIATSEYWKDREGNPQERTEWHRVAIFNDRLVEIAERSLRKGDMVYLEGQNATRTYEHEGQQRSVTEVVLRQYRGELKLIPRSGPGGQKGQQPAAGDQAAAGEPGADAGEMAQNSGTWTGPNPDESDDIPF